MNSVVRAQPEHQHQKNKRILPVDRSCEVKMDEARSL
jgi:hypothetical protein